MSVHSIRALVAALILFTVPLAVGHEDGGLSVADVTLTITPDSDPVQEGHEGTFIFLNRTDGEWFEWRLDTQEPQLVVDLHVHGDFAIDRPIQLVPVLTIENNSPGCEGDRARGLCDFPLFNPYPNPRVWEAEGAARVYSVEGTADNFTLMLRIPGPVNGTLTLQRDVLPPTFEIAEATNITHYSFLRDSRTNELVIGDTQVRRAGATDWVVNPTPVFHHLQHFPIQGLAADADYEVRTLFTDWAGNHATSETVVIHTLAAPDRPAVTATPTNPTPNATLTAGSATNVSVRFETPDSPIPQDGSGLTLFLDKKAITQGLVVSLDNEERTSGTITYTPAVPLGDGIHTVRFEITNEEGGMGAADWRFVIGQAAPIVDEPANTPGASAIALFAILASVAGLARRR